jgi:hypothetical protein
MKISISNRLKPFSHTPGAACLIPGTCWEIEAFPALIRLGKKYELSLYLTGPVKDFTLEQDLERNCVMVAGHAKEGFYRLKFQGKSGGIEMAAVNAPVGFLINGAPVRSQERLFFADEVDFFLPANWERLFLGVSKALDWDLVVRRFDTREILPLLFGLGQKLPLIKPQPLQGTGKLLEEGKLDSFCRAAFGKMLVPRLIDEQHQGLVLPETAIGGDPCFLLQEAARRIRALFFRQEGSQVSLLPANTFPSGRMTGIFASGIGEIDLEWASRQLRRAILRASSSEEMTIVLRAESRSLSNREKPTSSTGFISDRRIPSEGPRLSPSWSFNQVWRHR